MSAPSPSPLEQMPRHPFWCDECGGKAPFTIKGSRIDHDRSCPLYGETERQAEERYERAVAWLRRNPGKVIP